jgi:hypothetical protein
MPTFYQIFHTSEAPNPKIFRRGENFWKIFGEIVHFIDDISNVYCGVVVYGIDGDFWNFFGKSYVFCPRLGPALALTLF